MDLEGSGRDQVLLGVTFQRGQGRAGQGRAGQLALLGGVQPLAQWKGNQRSNNQLEIKCARGACSIAVVRSFLSAIHFPARAGMSLT